MNTKVVSLLGMLMLIATVPNVSAQTENGDCIGHSVEDPRTGNDTCVGVCENQRPGDDCTGVCVDGSCSLLHPVCNALGAFCDITEQQAASESNDESIDTATCYRVIPKTTIYSPLTGQPVTTINIPAEICI